MSLRFLTISPRVLSVLVHVLCPYKIPMESSLNVNVSEKVAFSLFHDHLIPLRQDHVVYTVSLSPSLSVPPSVVTHLVYTFNRNLFKVITARQPTIRNIRIPIDLDTPERILHRQSTLTKEGHKMLDMIVKHTVLNTSTIGLGGVLCFFWILTAVIDPDGALEIGSIMRLWLVIMMVVVFTTTMLL